MKAKSLLLTKKLPFITGVLKTSGSGSLPVELPLELEIDSATGLVRQKYSKLVDKYLKLAYLKGSLLSTPLGKGNFGNRRAGELLAVLLNALHQPMSRTRFLEVGCGDGYILRTLKSIGAKGVVGCEPGNVSDKEINELKITIIRDFFSADLFEQKFDVVFSYGVLEHLQQPIKSVMEMVECANAGGLLFAGVPNCERKLRLGDPGILAHEHWNYFTPFSFKNILSAAGLKNVKVVKGKNGAMLYGWGLKSSLIQKEQKLYTGYNIRLNKCMAILQSRINRLPGEVNDLGLYGGGTQLKGFLKFKSEPRLFDGDSAKRGKYYAGFKSAIEPAENLKLKPVKELWITAVDYDEEIQAFLKKIKLPRKIKIISLKKLLKSSGKQQ